MITKNRLCYWSVGAGEFAFLLKGLIRSARKAGVAEDFHFWSDRKIPGAITHYIDKQEVGEVKNLVTGI